LPSQCGRIEREGRGCVARERAAAWRRESFKFFADPQLEAKAAL